MVQKSLIIARMEYAQQIISACNNSGLPAFIMADVIKDVLTKLKRLADEEYQRDLQEYQAQVEQEQAQQKEQEQHDDDKKDGE